MGDVVWLNILSLVVSLTALSVSSYLARRHVAHARSQVVINFASFFTEARDIGFINDVRYVGKRLRVEFVKVVAVSELPVEIRVKIYRVTNYFDQLGLLVASKALDGDIVIGLLGNWLDQSWRSLEPYIILERRARRSARERGESLSAGYLEFFEDLVVRVRRTPPEVVQKEMGLQKIL